MAVEDHQETGIILPPGVRGVDPDPIRDEPAHVLIDNRTDLPNGTIEGAVRDYFVENASLAWGHTSTFQTYANEGGSLLARSKFTVPRDIFEEIRLCRDIAQHDDDIRTVIRMLIAVAYEGGMRNFHEDEQTRALFNEMAKKMNLDHWFEEIYREYLIAQQVTTVTAWIRERVSWTPDGSEEEQEERLACPRTTLLFAEDIRCINPGVFGEEALAYIPQKKQLREWLEEFFDPRTTPARKAALARQDPVSSVLFTDRVRPEEVENSFTATGLPLWAYKLNPRMASRFTAPKGTDPYPRPLLTANLALVEAKRLLNLMDYSLLQGGANFIVVAKKGNDQYRATQAELENLGRMVARASRTGVIVGDHRLDFDIITPNLTELLNHEKRALLGRKLAALMIGVPEVPVDSGGSDVMSAYMEFVARVITADRNKVKRHVESAVYDETAKRNRRVFTSGPAKIWHYKIVLQGLQFFTDMVLKLGDRGNISRRTLTEVAGFSWDAEVSQRQAELDSGVDEVMVPGAVPHDSPLNRAPNDSGDGRPAGGGPDQAAPPRLLRGPGEPVRAYRVDDRTHRCGEITWRLLEQYPDLEEGRITSFERQALDANETATQGPVTVIPVNQGHECLSAYRVVRLAPGLGAILGYRKRDRATVVKAFSFRQPEFDELAAQELVLNLGYGKTEDE